jgi:hypothetical protein
MARALRELPALRPHVKGFNLTDPVVRAKMRERYGTHIPMDEPVISPASMFNSPLLETVETR